MDATDLNVNYTQSYADRLSGFHLDVTGSSFDLTTLNPRLESFASVEAKSGFLDTLSMSVTGRKHSAYGEMDMYYHGLKVEYLVKGDTTHQTLKAETISFFANRIVHKKHQKGISDVYAKRDPEKGFVNYWVKIFLGGVLTDTGVRTDSKQERRYKNSIKGENEPTIPDNSVEY